MAFLNSVSLRLPHSDVHLCEDSQPEPSGFIISIQQLQSMLSMEVASAWVMKGLQERRHCKTNTHCWLLPCNYSALYYTYLIRQIRLLFILSSLILKDALTFRFVWFQFKELTSPYDFTMDLSNVLSNHYEIQVYKILSPDSFI